MTEPLWPTAQTCLDRIGRFDPELRAFTAVAPSAPRAPSPGPLDGLPIGVKANIAVAGLPWTAGIGAYCDRIAETDAACVAALREAGAIIIGLTNMHEGALGATTDNPWFGRTQNPWRRGFTAGGSSGGSAAATAAGMCGAAIGTDTFGSIRIPAAYTGLFGLKPAYGAIPTDGIVPLAKRFDHVGILAPSATLCGLVLGILGAEAVTEVSRAPAVGLLEEAGDPVAAALLSRRIARAGLSVGPVELADYDHARLIRFALRIAEADAFRHHRGALARDPDGFSPHFRELLQWGGRQSAERLSSANDAIDTARSHLERALAGLDVLLSLAVPGPAHAFDVAPPGDPSRHTLLASILGWAAVVFPIGLGPDGLPRAAQIMARNSAAALALAERLAVAIGPPPGFEDREIG